MSISRFIVSFIIFTALLLIGPLAIHYSSYAAILIPKFGVLFFFFSVLTFMVSISVLFAAKKDAGLSSQVFLIATTVKLILCMGMALAYVLKNQVNHVDFLICFFYLYLLNTAFEVYSLLTNLRNQNLQ